MRATATLERTMSTNTSHSSRSAFCGRRRLRQHRPHCAEAEHHQQRHAEAEQDLANRKRAVQQQPHAGEREDQQDRQTYFMVPPRASAAARCDVQLRDPRAPAAAESRYVIVGPAAIVMATQTRMQKRHGRRLGDRQPRDLAPGDTPEQAHADAHQRDESRETTGQQHDDQQPLTAEPAVRRQRRRSPPPPARTSR